MLLLDRDRFPRDKPCGGGLTIRAVELLPFSVAPVVEDAVQRVELRFRYESTVERASARPLVLMTQRRRLDAFLAEQAISAGADFRDGLRVTGIAADGGGVTVDVCGRRVRGQALVGADGANGITARTLGLCADPLYGVALEGNVPHDEIDAERYRGRVVFEIGSIRGGYGWVFPKGDHVNVGVGGSEREGPRLRHHLRRLCREHGVAEGRLRELRGHRLPCGGADARLAKGRALVVGDAAALVDPLSGDGIYEAVLSASLAAEATLDLLRGRAATVEPYERRLKPALAGLMASSWSAKRALERFPRAVFTVARADFVQSALERLARGEPHPQAARQFARVSFGLLNTLGRSRVERALQPGAV